MADAELVLPGDDLHLVEMFAQDSFVAGPTFPQSHVHVLQQLKTRDKLGSPGDGEVAQHILSPPSWTW